jgi:hypothetical protein
VVPKLNFDESWTFKEIHLNQNIIPFKSLDENKIKF